MQSCNLIGGKRHLFTKLYCSIHEKTDVYVQNISTQNFLLWFFYSETQKEDDVTTEQSDIHQSIINNISTVKSFSMWRQKVTAQNLVQNLKDHKTVFFPLDWIQCFVLQPQSLRWFNRTRLQVLDWFPLQSTLRCQSVFECINREIVQTDSAL